MSQLKLQFSINKSVIVDLSESETQNLEKRVKDSTVDRYDYYFTWGFFEYVKSHAGAYIVVIMYEIIRNAMIKRGNVRRN